MNSGYSFERMTTQSTLISMKSLSLNPPSSFRPVIFKEHPMNSDQLCLYFFLRRRKILADQLRVDDELTPAPDVEILNTDAVQTGDFDDEMDVDEPPVKVIISEDPIGELLLRGNLYADRKKNPAKNARARLRKRRDDDDVFSSSGNGVFLDRLSSSVKMDEALDARLRVTESEVPTKNFQVSDLREKLEHRKQAFNSRTRPNLSIEITED